MVVMMYGKSALPCFSSTTTLLPSALIDSIDMRRPLAADGVFTHMEGDGIDHVLSGQRLPVMELDTLANGKSTSSRQPGVQLVASSGIGWPLLSTSAR